MPSARATNGLLVVGFCALGYALYIRYTALEQSSVGLACTAGLDSWLCLSRKVITWLHENDVFGSLALILAALNLWRPSVVLFGLALGIACLGLVFYNVGLAALAVGLLILSLARPARARG